MAAKDELSFVKFSRQFKCGEPNSNANEQFSELLDTVRRTSGNGGLTIKLPFKAEYHHHAHFSQIARAAALETDRPAGFCARLGWSDHNAKI